jgi:hypothetical protein
VKELQFSVGQQIEWVIDDIRKAVKDDYISVEYVKGLFGPAVGIGPFLKGEE